MTSEKYRTYLTESIKTGAQMMYDMAEDIAERKETNSNLVLCIRENRSSYYERSDDIL